jgi:hypothetical protein
MRTDGSLAQQAGLDLGVGAPPARSPRPRGARNPERRHRGVFLRAAPSVPGTQRRQPSGQRRAAGMIRGRRHEPGHHGTLVDVGDCTCTRRGQKARPQSSVRRTGASVPVVALAARVPAPIVRYPSPSSDIRPYLPIGASATPTTIVLLSYCPIVPWRWAPGGKAYAVGYTPCTSPASWPPLPSPFQPSHSSGLPAPPQRLYLRPIGAEIHKTQPCTRSYSSTWRPSSQSPNDAALPAIPRSSSASFDAIWTVAF